MENLVGDPSLELRRAYALRLLRPPRIPISPISLAAYSLDQGIDIVFREDALEHRVDFLSILDAS